MPSWASASETIAADQAQLVVVARRLYLRAAPVEARAPLQRRKGAACRASRRSRATALCGVDVASQVAPLDAIWNPV